MRALLAALLALAFAPLLGLLVRVWTQGGYVTGADGLLVLDQMQYLNWLRQAGDHVLIENLYDLADGPRTFLHPGLLVSGALNALGLGMIAAYLVWKPVAVVALWAGARAWAARFLDGGERVAVVALALFFASPLAALVGWSGAGGERWKYWFDFIAGELSALNWLWGYLFTAIAVGLLPLGLLAYERGAAGRAAAAGAAIAWLQPWQGATYLIVLALGDRLRPSWRLAGVGLAGALPLAYYLVLSRTDPAWELAGEANAIGSWPWWVTVVTLAPLAVPAALGWRRTGGGFAGRALRAWPPAALAVYVLPFGTFPAHAWQGAVLPLAVLGALGLRGRGISRRVVAAALAALCLPGLAYRVDQLRAAVQAGRQPFFLRDGERAALRFLDADPRPGGVLAPVYSGLLVPAYTQRETWVGAGSWTPDFSRRSAEAEALFAGRMDAREAAALVRRTGARFLYADCAGRADLGPLLPGVLREPRRFGCARVWEVERR